MKKISYKTIEESGVFGFEFRIGFKNRNLPAITCRIWREGTAGKWRRVSCYDINPRIPIWSRPGTHFFTTGEMEETIYEINKKG